MKLKITQEVARPKGHWQVSKWNLLKGESEDTAEVINKDNLITDHCISELMTRPIGLLPTRRTYLQFSDVIPTVERTVESSVGDRINGGPGDTVYFFTSGATGSNVGKEVKGFFTTEDSDFNTRVIFMWLHLDQPLLIEEGDVLKVSYTLDPSDLGTVTTSGTIPYKTYAYGEDPEDPNAGTLVENIDFTASYNFTQFSMITSSEYTPVKNPDGSMSYGTDLKCKYNSGVRSINQSALTIPSVSCSVPVGANTRSVSIAFPNTKPVQEPGSYVEVEIDFNVRVLPHE